MEDFSTEIISLITETFDDDQDLISKILWYLYNTSNDDKMVNGIEYWLRFNGYCTECGGKMEEYEYEEKTDEFNSNITNVLLCPYCENTEISTGECYITKGE